MAIGRDAWTLLRWARTQSGVDVTDPAEVDEPPGGTKDTGFTSGGGSDTFFRVWHNWMLQQLGKGLEYLVGFTGEVWSYNQLTRGGQAANSANATGTSGTTTVTAFEAVMTGALYSLAQAVISSPVQNTYATMHRIIALRVTAGSPQVVRIDGTADATDPTLAANELALWRIVQASGSSTYTLEDLRNHGVLICDRLEVDAQVRVGATATPHLEYDGTQMLIGADWAVAHPTDEDGNAETGARLGRVTVHPAGMTVTVGTPTKGLTGVTFSADAQELQCMVHFPPGANLTKVVVAYTTTDATNGFSFRLDARQRQNGNSNHLVQGSVVDTGAGNAALTITASGLPVDVTADDYFLLILTALTNHDVTVHSIAIEYEDNYPLRGWNPLP